MSKHNFSNSVGLTSIFNDVVDLAYTITTTGTNYGIFKNDNIIIDYPTVKDNYWTLIESFTYPSIYTPSYPVSNYSVDESLTSIIQIAVSGFNENEIFVRREDLKLIIEGKKSKEREAEDKRKYFYRNIAERDFRVEYQGSEKWNFDKLEARISNGILTVTIPIKDEFKPVKQSFTIKK